MGYTLRTTLLLAILPVSLSAQTPHLTGTVRVDLHGGGLTGALCLEGVPPSPRVHFLLHRGLNIRHVSDAQGRSLRYAGFFGGEMVDDGVQYSIDRAARDTTGPGRLCVSYTGGFPVFRTDQGEYAALDFKGIIAFNGRTMRAADQARWYPVLREPESDRVSDRVTYDLQITCPGCRGVYVNGAPPATLSPGDSVVRLQSTAPVQPLLFVGDFGVREYDGSWFVNSDVTEATARLLSAWVERTKRYFEEVTGTAYGSEITFLEHAPLERYAPDRWWGFVTYPTVALAGRTFASYVDTTAGTLRTEVWPFIGHELAHWYFGTVLPPRGLYRWFFLESFAEYLGNRALRHFAGDSAYRARVRAHARASMEATTLRPLDEIRDAEDIDGLYRYAYGPALLAALEDRAGPEAMTRLLRLVLTAPEHEPRDFAFLRRAALASGIRESTWDAWTRRCVQESPARSCLTDLAR